MGACVCFGGSGPKVIPYILSRDKQFFPLQRQQRVSQSLPHCLYQLLKHSIFRGEVRSSSHRYVSPPSRSVRRGPTVSASRPFSTAAAAAATSAGTPPPAAPAAPTTYSAAATRYSTATPYSTPTAAGAAILYSSQCPSCTSSAAATRTPTSGSRPPTCCTIDSAITGTTSLTLSLGLTEALGLHLHIRLSRASVHKRRPRSPPARKPILHPWRYQVTPRNLHGIQARTREWRG